MAGMKTQTYNLIKLLVELTSQDDIYDVKAKISVAAPHKDAIRNIFFVQKERKYLTISREGTISIWMTNFRLVKSFSLKELGLNNAWILESYYIADQNRLIVITDDRR